MLERQMSEIWKVNMTNAELEQWFASFRKIKNFTASVTKEGLPCIELIFHDKENAIVFNKGMGIFSAVNPYELSVYQNDSLPELFDKIK